MSVLSSVGKQSETGEEPDHWTARYLKSIIFIIVALALFGAYLALNIPIAVFPSTNFPRIVIGVDNGVMPIDQMEVTVTRPIEEVVNSVPGLERILSITSRGSAEIDLFFNWNVDMFQTLQYVNAAVSRVQTTLPPTAVIEANRLTFAAFPIMGYSLTSRNNSTNSAVANGDIYDKAAIEPSIRCLHRSGSRRPGTRISSAARPGKTGRIADHNPEYPGHSIEK